MYPIRVSAKALIYRDKTILCSHYKSEADEWYVIPGGGVQGEEMAIEGVVREVLEETGYAIKVDELAFVREFIPSRLGNDDFRDGFHQIELYFVCSLVEQEPQHPTEHDKHQVGCAWLPLDKLNDYKVYPSSLQEAIRDRDFKNPYVGNVK